MSFSKTKKSISGKENCQCQVEVTQSVSLPPHGLLPARFLCPWNSPGQNTGVGSHSLLQGIFPTQGSNPGLPHCKWILYELNHKGSKRWEILLHFLEGTVTILLVILRWRFYGSLPFTYLIILICMINCINQPHLLVWTHK